MATSDRLEFTNYRKLSSGYRYWLTAIGGINTAVLTMTVLILTGKEIPAADSNHYATLLSALFVGIFTCFIGALLMGEAEAVCGDKEEAFHLFMIAIVNVHVAVILFLFSTMLLATVHKDLLGENNVPAVIFSMLLFIGLTSLLWMVFTARAFWSQIDRPDPLRKKPLPKLTIGIVVIGIVYYLIAWSLYGITKFPVPLTLCALSSAISLITFVFVLEVAMAKEQASGWRLWVAPGYIVMYAVGVFLPLVSVMWLAWGII